MPELLFAVADGDDALAVAVPGEVVDFARDDRVFAFRGAGARGAAVPDADGAGGVAGGTVVAGGGDAGDGCRGGVAGVLG